MPNVGRPSRDCHLCRQRRVKCDLGQPACNRCIRLGRSCPGYRNESELVFRLESPSSFAEGANRDRRRKRPSPSGQASSSLQSTVSTDSDEAAPEPSEAAVQSPTTGVDQDVVIFAGWYLQPSRQLAECWDTRAMSLALSNLCSHGKYDGVSQGVLISLPQMISVAKDDSSILLVCRAVGTAFLTCRVDTAEARSKRASTYGRALSATNAALQDPVLQVQDETLASIWLLSLYELIVTSAKADPPVGHAPQNHGVDSWIIHTQGLISLLRMRGTAHMTSSASRGLFWLVYNTIQVRCFITGLESPVESASWFRGLEQNLTEAEMPTYKICTYAHRASTLCSQIRHFINHGSTRSSDTAPDLLADAALFESEMSQSWDDIDNGVEAGPPTDPASHRVVCCRTFFYAFRLKLQLSLLELLNKAQVETYDLYSTALGVQRQFRVQAVQDAADEILASIPLLFSTEAVPGVNPMLKPRFWSDGVRMLWPLRLVALWTGTTEDQKLTAQTMLGHIREELGVRPNTGAFLPLQYVGVSA